MIEVDRLSKQYGSIAAVDRLTFHVGRGEIVGLLGPNGAGKTTTMRMLTTFLPPSSGRARLAGHDVLDEPLQVRRQVGYLPESVPLYLEMRVREYLTYRAKLRDVPGRRRRAAIDYVLTRCGLTDVQHRILGQLSKGYRQRVGLADSMVHDPDILILDEPTAGLDPVQVREVRALIRELGDRHTIILSTHIMSEVEAVCSRVIIIARGRLQVDEPLERLQSEHSLVVEVRGHVETAKTVIEGVKGVVKTRVVDRSEDAATFDIKLDNDSDPAEQIAERLIKAGLGVRRLQPRRSSLEDRFIEAVGQANLESDANVVEISPAGAA